MASDVWARGRDRYASEGHEPGDAGHRDGTGLPSACLPSSGPSTWDDLPQADIRGLTATSRKASERVNEI